MRLIRERDTIHVDDGPFGVHLHQSFNKIEVGSPTNGIWWIAGSIEVAPHFTSGNCLYLSMEQSQSLPLVPEKFGHFNGKYQNTVNPFIFNDVDLIVPFRIDYQSFAFPVDSTTVFGGECVDKLGRALVVGLITNDLIVFYKYYNYVRENPEHKYGLLYVGEVYEGMWSGWWIIDEFQHGHFMIERSALR